MLRLFVTKMSKIIILNSFIQEMCLFSPIYLYIFILVYIHKYLFFFFTLGNTMSLILFKLF